MVDGFAMVTVPTSKQSFIRRSAYAMLEWDRNCGPVRKSKQDSHPIARVKSNNLVIDSYGAHVIGSAL